MVQGTCLCSGIAWEVSGDFTRMSHCHCSRCRKAHGAAFATFIAASADGFRWLRGRELIQRGERELHLFDVVGDQRLVGQCQTKSA